jgi:hypothetical protein
MRYLLARKLRPGLVQWNNLSMKECSLFCFVLFCSYEIHRNGMLQIVFLVSLESSQRERVHMLCSMVFGVAVQTFWNIE